MDKKVSKMLLNLKKRLPLKSMYTSFSFSFIVNVYYIFGIRS